MPSIETFSSYKKWSSLFNEVRCTYRQKWPDSNGVDSSISSCRGSVGSGTRSLGQTEGYSGARGQLTQYEYPVLATVVGTFKEVMAELAIDYLVKSERPLKEQKPQSLQLSLKIEISSYAIPHEHGKLPNCVSLARFASRVFTKLGTSSKDHRCSKVRCNALVRAHEYLVAVEL